METLKVLIYNNNRRIVQQMNQKKPLIIPQLQKPKRALTLSRQINYISNESNNDFRGLKGNSITKKEEIKMNICKPHHLEIKKSFKKISIRNIEEIQENKIIDTPLKEKIDHDSHETSRQSNQLSSELKYKKNRTSPLFFPKSQSKSLLNVQIDQNKQNFLEFQQLLKRQNYIQNSNSLFLTMKHEKFYEIVLRIIVQPMSANNGKENKVDSVQRCIERLKDHYLNFSSQRQEKKLHIQSNLNSHQYNPSRYKQTVTVKTHKIQELQEQINHLQQAINQKQQQLTHITTNLGQKISLNQSYELRLYQIRQSITKQEEKFKQISTKALESQANLKNIEEKYHDAVQFVNNQEKNKILKQVSNQYKQIESDIYQYAVYLQSNQLANDIHYEPRPFTEIETYINAELKETIADITKNKDKTITQKCIQMKEFVQGSMSKFKKKDSEMLKLNEFRTNCIVNFIHKMQKWLNNWQLKQEYLMNLKKQFIGICIILKQTINCNLSKHFQQISQENLRNQYQNMLKMVQQLELNFNHGNSFY